MMRTLTIAASLAAAACSSESGNGNSANETRDTGGQIVNSIQMNPGRWKSKIQVADAVVDGMAPDELARAKEETNGQVHTMCLTAKDLANPAEEIFSTGSAQCKYDHFTMKNGKIDAFMRCDSPEGSETITMKGAFEATRYRLETVATVTGKQNSRMTMLVDGEYLGACTGDEDG